MTASCGFAWCDQARCDDSDHWGVVYHEASQSYGSPEPLLEGQTAFRIGIGVKYEQGGRPSVVIHLDGGRSDYDCDAFLRIDEAVEIRDALTQAIVDAHVEEALG